VGGELRAAVQDEPVQPLIPLGSKGQLQGVHWQVVGFQHRMGVEPGDDEHFGWSEYLLYNQKRGFAFLVDSEEGWSMVRPTTGAPQLSSNGRTATYMGTKYELKYSYEAETTYVLGEFYWQVSRGQKTSNRDFASSKGVLSLEQSRNEVTWSAGDKIASDTVAKAFKLDDKKDVLQRDDPGPFRGQVGHGLRHHHPDCGGHHHPAHHPQPLLQLRPAGGELLVQFQLPQLGWLVRRLLLGRRPQVTSQ
jgi:hypothetical protein